MRQVGEVICRCDDVFITLVELEKMICLYSSGCLSGSTKNAAPSRATLSCRAPGPSYQGHQSTVTTRFTSILCPFYPAGLCQTSNIVAVRGPSPSSALSPRKDEAYRITGLEVEELDGDVQLLC